jgi:hypothetical protein
VEACPSVTYLIRKFARRRKKLLAVASGFAALLVLGVVGLIIGIVAVDRPRQKTQFD